MATVLSVCTGTRKGTVKQPRACVTLIEDYGIEGDAHAGNRHRQVSLLALESTEKMKNTLPDLQAGAFAENILTEGICLHSLAIGTQLRVGDAVLEVTQIGKECHADCEIMKIYLKIDDAQVISDVKFETFGCGSAIASSSMATELIKGQPISEALKLSNKAVTEALDGLPAHKLHCSVLAEEAIKTAVRDYYDRNGIAYDPADFPQEEDCAHCSLH